MTAFDELRETAKKRGEVISPLLPADWIELKGKFTVKELKLITKTVEANYKKVNGNKK